MKQYLLTQVRIEHYQQYLYEEERSEATIEKYLRYINRFAQWLESRNVTKELVLEWKRLQISNGYAASTINAGLSALNGLFRFLGWGCFHVRFLRVQRRSFRVSSKELTKPEYRQLCVTARKAGKEKAALLMETIGSTGIRVGEIRYITVENVQAGRADIWLKGKLRTILLPFRLCRRLLRYAKKQGIKSGEIFRGQNGKPIKRYAVWYAMKQISILAGVEATRVFPHNLRHLFAVTYYKMYHDIAKLADILGHSSLETTRIYLLTTGAEHQKQLENLQLLN